MKNLLMSAAIGDIAGSAYEGRGHRTKDYNSVKMFSSRARFTDDTVCTFACAEAFIDHLDMAKNLWKCRQLFCKYVCIQVSCIIKCNTTKLFK